MDTHALIKVDLDTWKDHFSMEMFHIQIWNTLTILSSNTDRVRLTTFMKKIDRLNLQQKMRINQFMILSQQLLVLNNQLMKKTKFKKTKL